MGFFFNVLSAINDPQTQGSVDQLNQVVNTIEQVTRDNGITDTQMQTILSSLGKTLPSILKQQGVSQNLDELGGKLGQLTSGQVGEGNLLNSVLTDALTQQTIQGLSEKTGLDASTLRGVVPSLIPALLNFLSLGKTSQGISGGNPLLNAFLDADKDGDVDLGDVFILANRFLNK